MELESYLTKYIIRIKPSTEESAARKMAGEIISNHKRKYPGRWQSIKVAGPPIQALKDLAHEAVNPGGNLWKQFGRKIK